MHIIEIFQKFACCFVLQVERKRHIGNDIVNIVFQECESHERPTFTPYGIRSQFTRILLIELLNIDLCENQVEIKVW